jgi:hypothetical protein
MEAFIMKKIISCIIGLASICLCAASLSMQCAPKDDGTYMNCHKANIVVTVLSVVITIIAILLPLIKESMNRCVLLAASAVASLISAITPGIIISLCMMPEMTCRSIFRPFTIAISFMILLLSLGGLLYEKKVAA